MRFILVLLLLCAPLAAQHRRYSIGVTGGVPLNRMTAARGPSDESPRYTFGLSFELYLNRQISVDINPLYRRTGLSYSFGFGPGASFPDRPGFIQTLRSDTRLRAHTLQLPVIGRYTFRPATARWRPFVGAGFAFQTAWQTSEFATITRDPATGDLRTLRGEFSNRSSLDAGAVTSVGLRYKYIRFEFSPEVRYTRWGGGTGLQNRNQAEALLTIRF